MALSQRRDLTPLPARERIKVRVLIQRAVCSARDSRFCLSLLCRGSGEKLIDFTKHLISVRKHLIVPESKHSIAARIQERRPKCIFARLIGVLAAIEFDNQAPFDRTEVGEVGTDRMLTPEFDLSHPAAAQVAPEDSLGVGLFAAQTAGVLLGQFGALHGRECSQA